MRFVETLLNSQGRSWRIVLGDSVTRPIDWLRTIRRNRRGRNELMALDDRLLMDIGLGRSDIEYAVRHGWLPRRDTGLQPGSNNV